MRKGEPWNSIVIRSEETRRKVAEVCYNQQWMTQVPVFIVDIPELFMIISQRIEKPNGYFLVFSEMSLSVGFFYLLEYSS